MSKVLFINGPAEGHINPTLGLVRELIHRGEEVVYLAPTPFRRKIELTGAEFREFNSFYGKPDPGDPPGFLGMMRFLLRSADKVIHQAMELTTTERYDYVVHDAFFGWGALIAHLLKATSISSNSTFAPVINSSMTGKDKSSTAQLEEIKQEMLKLSSRYGFSVSRIQDIMFNKGIMNLVYTSEYFQPHRHLFDETYHFVGPSIADREDAPDFTWSQLEGAKSIYISLGTIANDDRSFYEDCFKAFAEMPYQFVMSIGNKISESTLTGIPSNFILQPYTPQLEILKRADLFITHGGMNSVSEALYHDVPLIVIPQSADQPIVASRLEELGCGIKMSRQQATPEALRSTVNRVISNNAYKRNCSIVGETLRNAGGYKRAADLIMAMTKKR